MVVTAVLKAVFCLLFILLILVGVELSLYTVVILS